MFFLVSFGLFSQCAFFKVFPPFNASTQEFFQYGFKFVLLLSPFKYLYPCVNGPSSHHLSEAYLFMDDLLWLLLLWGFLLVLLLSFRFRCLIIMLHDINIHLDFFHNFWFFLLNLDYGWFTFNFRNNCLLKIFLLFNGRLVVFLWFPLLFDWLFSIFVFSILYTAFFHFLSIFGFLRLSHFFRFLYLDFFFHFLFSLEHLPWFRFLLLFHLYVFYLRYIGVFL